MNDSKFLSLNGLIYYDEKLKSRIKELYGSDMTVEWQEIKDGKNPFKLKIALKNGNGTELFAKTVDFPLEQTIVSGSYENSTKSLILYFQDGTSTKIPIKDLIEGLASKLDLDKKANLGVKTRDSNTAHIRDIPENALPYAGISKIGGMSYKSQNLVKQPYSFGSQTIQGVTITVNSDNSITFNGTSTGDIALNMGQVYLRKDVSYTINGIKNLTEAQALFYVKTGGFFDKLLINSNGAVTKTCLKDGEAALELYIYRGTTIKQTVYPMFNEGSTSLPYEPYFEGLRHAKGTAAKSVGANLFDTNSLIPRTYIDLNSGNLVEESVDGWYCTQPIEVKDSVTISGIVNTTNGAVRYRTLNTSGSVVSVADIGLFTKKTITLSSDEKFLQICLRSNNLKTCNINHGTEALPYSPYFEHTIAIPEAVQNEEWYGIGIPNTEYYNSIDLENGKGDIKAKKIVLNGTENFLISKLTDYHYFYVPIGDVGVKPNTDLLCDQYDSTNESTRDKTCFVGSGGVAIRDDRFTTANDFKTYLAEQYANGTPVTLICAMATPTTEDIDITDDNLIGVEGGGTVTLVNEYGYDIPCDIDFFTGDNKIVGSRVFVGDLMGRASFAKYFDVGGSPSEKTIAEALEDLTREDSPIKVTSTSIGQKATEGLELTVSTDVLANPPAEIGDIVIDAYTDAENLSYINLWEITGFDAGYSTMRIVGINSVNTGGGSASFAQKAEADGNGNNIAGTYATKQALKALEDSANDSIHNIEAAIDGVEANGQALADKFDSLGAVNGVVAKAVTATNAESAKAGSGLDISIRDASVNASDALTKATNALASAAENHTIIQNFPNTYAKISDLSNYSLLTESGNSVSVSWEPPINGVNPYKLNIKLINAKGNEISSAQIDFPLEQMVVGAEYTESTKELVLETLEGTVKVPVSDIFRGLITESNIGNQTVAKASLATKATNDGQGNDIVQTYATNSNLSALENRVDNLDSDGQALAERLDSLSIVNGVVAKAVTATNAESAKAGSGLDNDITQARKDASDSLAKANSVLSLVNENKTQLEAIFNEDAPATVQKAKYAETAGSADYASRCRDSNGNPLLISNIVTKADAAELLASQANLASKNAIVSARCEYIKSSYQASVGTLNLYLKTADNREIAVTDFQEALISLLEDFMS